MLEMNRKQQSRINKDSTLTLLLSTNGIHVENIKAITLEGMQNLPPCQNFFEKNKQLRRNFPYLRKKVFSLNILKNEAFEMRF